MLSFLPVQLEALLYNIILQLHATLHASHSLDEAGPVLLCQALVAPEASKLADVADVRGGVVLGRRRPAGDDVPDAAEPVLRGVGAQEAKGGAEAPLYRGKLTKALPSGSGEGVFSFPEGLSPTDVQGVIVLNFHVCLFFFRISSYRPFGLGVIVAPVVPLDVTFGVLFARV